MTDITDRKHSIVYDGERQLCEVDVTIDGESPSSRNAGAMLAVIERVEDAVTQELQTIQDEIDEGEFEA